MAQADSVEAGRAAIDKWRRDGAGGLLHAHVRLMGSVAGAGAAALPNEGGGRGRGVRVPYSTGRRHRHRHKHSRGRREAGKAGEAQVEASDIDTYSIARHNSNPSTCSYAVSPSSILPPDWGQRYFGGEGTGDWDWEERTPPGQLKGTAVADADADCRRRRCV